jgi:hypothetical protein
MLGVMSIMWGFMVLRITEHQNASKTRINTLDNRLLYK